MGDGGRFQGLTAQEALQKLGTTPGPERVLDLLLRTGPFGDGFDRADGLSLSKLKAEPHGIDLGALREELPHVLRTPDAMIDLAPSLLMEDVARLERELEAAHEPFTLIGRRHLRSNNSWMHNITSLTKGKARCTLLLHPADAERSGLAAGDTAQVESAAGWVHATVEITEDMMPGVVSLPHGFGHDVEGSRQRVASLQAGANVNRVSDPSFLDAVSGNAAFNGLGVRVSRVG